MEKMVHFLLIVWRASFKGALSLGTAGLGDDVGNVSFLRAGTSSLLLSAAAPVPRAVPDPQQVLRHYLRGGGVDEGN